MSGKCDHCDSATINGVFCHEHGCYQLYLDKQNEVDYDEDGYEDSEYDDNNFSLLS